VSPAFAPLVQREQEATERWFFCAWNSWLDVDEGRVVSCADMLDFIARLKTE
jgi:hypothetical protein